MSVLPSGAVIETPYRGNAGIALIGVLFAERTLEKALPKLANEATNPELKAAIEHHLEETKGHIANLAQIFDSLGMTDRGTACPGILGLI